MPAAASWPAWLAALTHLSGPYQRNVHPHLPHVMKVTAPWLSLPHGVSSGTSSSAARHAPRYRASRWAFMVCRSQATGFVRALRLPIRLNDQVNLSYGCLSALQSILKTIYAVQQLPRRRRPCPIQNEPFVARGIKVTRRRRIPETRVSESLLKRQNVVAAISGRSP